MTLNITVVTRYCIYQSADYRLTDRKTNETIDFETQKIVLINTFGWTASVCFAGIGRTTYGLDVGNWLTDCTNSIQPDDPFERLLDKLLEANDWLSSLSGDRRHSFSVGAFIGSEPVFALVSNFEEPSGHSTPNASASLFVFEVRPTKPTIFISGQKQAVTRDERKWLVRLATKNPEPQRIYSALAEVNRRVATRTNKVSSACFTTHVRFTGEGGGNIHDIGNRPLLPKFAIPAHTRQAVTQLLDQQFGPGRAQFAGMSTVRADASDEYHLIQLREKPQDPSTHTNYGAFLKEKKGDLVGAEREYQKAIELDGNHVNALGNLANLIWESGNKDQAASLYRRALDADPGNENVTWNYTRFLMMEVDVQEEARNILDRAISTHPESGRLHLLQGELNLLDRRATDALESFRRARETGADQAGVECGYAFALHLSSAPIGECISAYRTAIALRPGNGALKLNLAQLLFIKGNEMEANRNLQEATKLGLDESAQLEAQFYLLAYTSNDPTEIFRTTKLLLSRGGRLRWNVQPNIEQIKQHDPPRSDLLEIIATIMAGDLAQDQLDRVFLHWS